MYGDDDGAYLRSRMCSEWGCEQLLVDGGVGLAHRGEHTVR
ncbi:hypothetical protein [Salinadaptatus halalkaliphilus]|nr:hypothetical protein [Salinadaptatus halalkaliphilus]